MREILRLVVAVSALFSGVLYADDEMVLPQKCTDPVCERTAQVVQWPKPLSGKVIEVQVGRFVMNIPARPVKSMSSHASDITLAYADGSAGYSLGVAATSKDVQAILGGSQYTVYDLMNIAFTKTSKDIEPAALKDLLVWRSALLFNKPLYFKNAAVFVAENGNLKFFYTKPDGGESSRPAGPVVVLDQSNKDSFLTIGATGVDFETFISSVATVRRK